MSAEERSHAASMKHELERWERNGTYPQNEKRAEYLSDWNGEESREMEEARKKVEGEIFDHIVYDSMADYNATLMERLISNNEFIEYLKEMANETTGSSAAAYYAEVGPIIGKMVMVEINEMVAEEIRRSYEEAQS